ncbi:hypothetical protein [Novosphingobium sp. TH158]|uniref:hypothetical protein n=1 Tax=Novosphingobium sp. TH158 TaxID=2067455 RepID=UPI000C7A7656|nr:hypothetical protein [Novosphingobium sp. TH158]PLK26332.1 hypothetical protein C0V78_05145 [Novosphingobium sp. TH158]
MYRVAQWIVRHKVLVVGVAAAGFIFFGNDKPENDQPKNPWASGTAEAVVVHRGSDKESLTDKAVSAVSGVARDYAGIEIGEVKQANTDNWAAVTDAAKKASD